MKRIALIFALGLFCVTPLFSQKLSGTVSDENGNPLRDVNIIIKGSYSGTTTDENGAYTLQLKRGKNLLVFTYLGFESTEKEVNSYGSDAVLNVMLFTTAILTDEVVVSATRAGLKTPTAYVNIDENEIRERNSVQDIPYLLELTPSFVATSEAGNGVGYTGFRVRGTDATRINVTINGIPFNDAESQSIFWVNMPDFSSSVSSIQIQRGVGTSGNGSASFGASLNMETDFTGKKPYARVQFTAGSFNTFKENLILGTGIADNGMSFDVRMSKLNSDGYINYSGSDHSSFLISGAWRNQSTLIRANVIYGNEKTGISWWGVPSDSLQTNRTYNPAGEYYDETGTRQYYKNQTDNYVQTHYQVLLTKQLGKFFSINSALHYTRGDGYYEQYEQDQMLSEYGFINDSTSDMIIRKWMGNNFYGIVYAANYQKGRINAKLGGACNQYDGNHFGKIIWMRSAYNSEINHEYYRNTGNKTDVSNYIKLDLQLNEAINLYGDIQYRYIFYRMAGTDDDLMPDNTQKILDQQHSFNFFNPKAGVFYEINTKMNTYFSFALGHREPTRANYEDAVGDANSTPKPETLFDYELGYRYSDKFISAGINIYFMDYTDQIIPTGQKSSVGYDIMTNVRNSYRCGIELTGSLLFFERLKLNMNVTLSRNKIRNFVLYADQYDADWNASYIATPLGETDIAYSPTLIGAVGLSWNAFKNFVATWSCKFVGKQYFDNTMSNDRVIEPYCINNFQLDYNIFSTKTKELSLRFSVNNIFNVTYSSNAYGGVWFEQGVEKTWAYFYPQAGINFSGGINIRF
ncbi:MAG TPA: TonB-dependent receptor [Bacteroidales bacterium]|nr:TonB-dependent receptor [Bacteroidales bacterium]